MIELDIRLPLPQFTLEVRARLDAHVTALVGGSGAGKTSLLETIAGLRRRATGRIAIDGVAIDALPPERRNIGYVPQDAALFPHLSVRDNITFARRDAARFDSLVATLALDPLLARSPASLSGGERQRVALARALMTSPRLLLLDEPLASIDQPLKEKILVYLRRVRDTERVPMLYVTHQPFEALALAGDCVVLREGRVVAQGPPAEVLRRTSAAIENVFELFEPRHEPAQGITRARTADGLELALPYDVVGAAEFPLVVRIGGDEIVVFTQQPAGVSSRNVLGGEVESIAFADGYADVVVRTPSRIDVRITRAAADELALRAGARVWLAMRSRAFRVVG